MKTFKITIALLIATSAVFTSCKKEKSQEEEIIKDQETQVEEPSQIGSFFSGNVDDAKQVYNFDATTSKFITGAKGTQLYIPGNAFVDKNGNAVTGNVDLTLIEIYEKADMILLDKATMSNGKPIISDGQFKLEVKQNGENLQVASGKSVEVTLPYRNNAPDYSMEAFLGSENSSGEVNWNTATSLNDPLTLQSDTVGYGFDLTDISIQWVNVDRFSNGNLVDLSVSIAPTAHSSANTAIYLHYSSINSITKIYSINQLQATSSYKGEVLDGEAITIVAVSEINGQFYSAFKPVTISGNMSEALTLTATTKQDFINEVNGL